VDDAFAHLTLAAEVAGLGDLEITLPDDREVELRGLRFHYLDWGGEGPTVVFLHGGLLTAHTWDLVCLALRDRYRCLALDLRGHGDTDWAPDGNYDLDEFVADIDAFLTELGLEEPALVGQSLGALAALAFTAHDPGRASALVLVDIGARVRIQGANDLRGFATASAGPRTLDELIELSVGFNPRRHPALLERSLLHNLRAVDDGRYVWKYDGSGLAARFERTRAAADTIPDLARRVSCPTLVVRGGESALVEENSARDLAALLPHGRLVTIAGAGHNVQGDEARALATELREFLATCD
jgi:pimeloyl-ACP methyl ester carboxylesterase